VRSYKVFYSLDGGAGQVSSDRPVEMSEADIYTDLLGGLDEDGDFFGLIDDRATTLQVMYKGEDDSYWIEIPCPEKRGSFGCALSFDEITDLFKSLPERFSESMIPKLEFESWG
jgi:hypothetical protein